MTNTPSEQGLPPSLRLLKGLVITLMITMIVGVITIVGLLVTRMPKPIPLLPQNLTLPAGLTAEAVTIGKGWIGVVTQDQQFLIFRPDGTIKQTVKITPDN